MNIHRNIHIHLSSKDTILFLERLHMYMSAQIGIADALRECLMSKDKTHSYVVERICADVEAGLSLSRVLERYTSSFRPVIGMLRAGETGGHLEESIRVARDHVMRLYEFKKKIISSMMYPFMIGIFSLILIIGLVRGILPQIVPILKGLHQELPLLTKITIFLSDILIQYIPHILVFSTLFVICSIVLYRRGKKFTEIIQHCLLRIPVIGKLIFMGYLSLWARSLGSMLSVHVHIREGYTLSIESLRCIPLKIYMKSSVPHVLAGKRIGDILVNLPFAPPGFFISIIRAGEMSGMLGDALLRSAHIIDTEIDYALKKITSMIEPILMICVGSFIGTIALSIIMPIYNMSKALQHI